MTIEERMDRLEKRLGQNDELVIELRDALTVTAYLEARQSKVLKEQAGRLVELEEDRKEHKERMKDLDRRIADLVSGFGEFIRRQKP
jgi:uncharacterized coiled-coil protein SlyX